MRRRAYAAAAALGCAALGACRAPLPPPRDKPPRTGGTSDVDLREVLAPANVRVLLACTPTGPELCFDATDNNCNGIIDEGCGVETGPLQFAIAWGEGADVDLEVRDPTGELAKPGEHTPLGLLKDRDCGRPQSSCHGQNTENVFFAGDRPPPGRYRIRIKLDSGEGLRFPVRVRFGGRIGIKTFSLDLELTSPEDEKTFTFAVD